MRGERERKPEVTPTAKPVRAAPVREAAPGRAIVQAKLVVGATNDPMEREADVMADQVVTKLRRHPVRPAGVAQRTLGGAARIRRSMPQPSVVARPTIHRIQRQGPIGAEGGDLDSSTAAALQSQRGRGRPLDGPVRTSMESAFGADFSSVRVHDGPPAQALNRSLSARAFTMSSDIFFRAGAPNGSSADGQRLLAHELTHVVQQGGASPLTSADTRPA